MNNIIKKLPMFLIVLVLLFITGCTSSSDVNFSNMLTVVYDGNGGFLGNKTYTTRKLKVLEDSKIPKYVQEYPEKDPYVVSSLGLATKEGYILKGWYLEENASYQENPYGTYVYLDLADGNGIYNLDDNGEYVLGYVSHENGEFILIYVEEALEQTGDLKYIYYQGDEGFGFYIYDPDNAEHAEIFERDGSYTPEYVENFKNPYYQYELLTNEEKTLFADAPRYDKEFYPYSEGDEGLDRYSFESGYADLNSMMELDTNGLYVYFDNQYVLFDSENPEHDGLERYSINQEKYKFTPNDVNESPSDLTKYEASIVYWDFENDRVTEDITLKAHWIKKLTVVYHEMSGQTTEVTTKRNDKNTEDIDLTVGDSIGKIERLPVYSGYTFVGWSKSETEYIPWNFDSDTFPVDTDTLDLYAYMIEGTYTRITNANELLRVANDLDGNYLLCNDIDLAGATYLNRSPLGFNISTSVDGDKTPFTGTFKSLGFKISNFTLEVRNSQKFLFANQGIEVVSGLFPYVQNATIEGLNVENATVVIDTDKMGTNVICDLGAAGLIGTAFEGTTTVKDSSIDITFTASSTNVVDCTVYVGDVVAKGATNITTINTTTNIDYTSISGITTGTLEVQTLR